MSTQSVLTANTTTTEKRRPKTSTVVAGTVIATAKNAVAASADGKPNVVTANVDAEAKPAATGSVLDNLLMLREQGTAYYNEFFVPGRNAMLAIMANVYAQFHAAKSSPTYQDNLKAICAKLKQYGVKLRETSSDASLFIRMVFKDFDDKQVSIYSRSLAVAYGKGVTPEAFDKFVLETVGGFYGIVAGGGKSSQDGAAGTAGRVAFTDIQAEKTVETIDNFQWDSDEEKCVLVAIRGMDDDSATLKKLAVSEELFFSILAKYAAEKKALLKKAVSGDIETTKLALKKVEGQLANAQTEVDNLQAELRAAEQAGKVKDVKIIRVNLLVATSNRDETIRTRKKLQAEIEADSKQAAVA